MTAPSRRDPSRARRQRPAHRGPIFAYAISDDPERRFADRWQGCRICRIESPAGKVLSRARSKPGLELALRKLTGVVLLFGEEPTRVYERTDNPLDAPLVTVRSPVDYDRPLEVARRYHYGHCAPTKCDPKCTRTEELEKVHKKARERTTGWDKHV